MPQSHLMHSTYTDIYLLDAIIRNAGPGFAIPRTVVVAGA